MSAAASWLLALLWVTLLAIAEAGLLLVGVHLWRRFPSIVAYWRSLFDDPVNGNKASIARVCAGLAMLGAVAVTLALIRFAFAHGDEIGMAGILAGAAATLLTSGVLGLLLRKGADGSTQAVNDERRTREQPVPVANAPIVTNIVQQPPAPGAGQ